MSFLIVFHFVLSLLAGVAIAATSGIDALRGFAVGALLVMVNLLLLHFSWKRILEKKLLVLAVGVIVFKYATLGFIIYQIASYGLLPLGWLIVGLGTVIPTALATAFWVRRQEAVREA